MPTEHEAGHGIDVCLLQTQLLDKIRLGHTDQPGCEFYFSLKMDVQFS